MATRAQRLLRLLVVAGFAPAAAHAADVGARMAAPEHLEAMLADLSSAAAQLEPHSPARDAFEAGRLDDARAMLGFRPLAESPTPEGFPSYTPVGVIEVKRYPAYRKAVGPNFWALFNHIQSRSIPMTAPVEMEGANGRRGDQPMAFLYQNTEVGALGSANGVEVEQTPATTVVSLGVRGEMSQARVDEALSRLEAWLSEQSEWRRAGEPSRRVFAYNSPMVSAGDRYWEVQLRLLPATR